MVSKVSEYVGTGHCPVHFNNISNYKLQNTNYKQIPIPKLQIPNKVAPYGQVLNAYGGEDGHCRGLIYQALLQAIRVWGLINQTPTIELFAADVNKLPEGHRFLNLNLNRNLFLRVFDKEINWCWTI